MSKKTGRSKFSKHRKTILYIGFIFKISPKFLLKFLWDYVKPYSQIPFVLIRYLILKSLIKDCGDNIYIGTNVVIKNWKNLSLANNISIHDNCYIDASGCIIIGNNVSIAHNSTLLSSTHTFLDKKTPIKYNHVISKQLIICDDVWIGCGVRVLCNLEINSRSIIAAGAVLNTSVESNTIYGGVPAKKIKQI